jgi:methionine-gamma-lyase
MPEIFAGRRGPDEGGCYLYGRHFNPTVYVLGRYIAALEGTEAAYATSSGMGAISAVLLQLCQHGDHVVAANTLYGGTYALLSEFLPAKAGIEVTFVDIRDHAAVAKACTKRTRLIYCEGIANPTLTVADIPALKKIAQAHNAQLVVDNTFSPLVLSPAPLGADIVVHSLTKFISGASDIIAGAICGSTAFVRELMDLHTGALMLLGPTMDPQIAFDLSLRFAHLGLRMQEHSKRALFFAERLRERGLRVCYPGLKDHPDHATLARQHNPEYGFGGIFTIDVGTVERANELMEALQNDCDFGYMAVSLGYFDTLMSNSGTSTSSELTDEAKAKAGITAGLVRMSIGYTGTIEQRWGQMEKALNKLKLGRA